MKYFKGDEKEKKIYLSGDGMLSSISLSLSEYFEDVYGSKPLGEFLYDEKRFPLTNAIKREIFIGCFQELFQAWAFCGTFESYILVFKKIFGEDVEIVFTVPGPGKLVIDITATGLQDYEFLARSIVDEAYVSDTVVDEVDDTIVFSTVQGIETQSELEKVLFTMVPNGIYTTVSLTIG